MAARGIPMLFMGQEFLADQQWDDAGQLFPELLIDWTALGGNTVMQNYRQFTSRLDRAAA